MQGNPQDRNSSTSGGGNVAESDFASLRPVELERLDTLVSDYLVFRSFKQTQQQLESIK